MEGFIEDSMITFVLQGAIPCNFEEVLDSIECNFPKSKILVSTWKGETNPVLSDGYEVIYNDDPGVDEIYDKNSLVFNENTSRQIVSSTNGLHSSSTLYSIKMRSDCILTGRGLLQSYIKALSESSNDNILLLSSINTINPFGGVGFVHHYSDWFMFGKTSQMRNFWDLASQDVGFISGEISNNESLIYPKRFPFAEYTAEQRIFHHYIESKFNEKYTYCDRRHSFANLMMLVNEFAVASPEALNIYIPKYDYLCTKVFHPRKVKQRLLFKLFIFSEEDRQFFVRLAHNDVLIFQGLRYLIKCKVSNFVQRLMHGRS